GPARPGRSPRLETDRFRAPFHTRPERGTIFAGPPASGANRRHGRDEPPRLGCHGGSSVWARRIAVTGAALLLAALPASAQTMGGPAGHTKVYVAEEESDAVSVFEARRPPHFGY